MLAKLKLKRDRSDPRPVRKSPSDSDSNTSRICIGDKVSISTDSVSQEQGIVQYIGCPYPTRGRGVRYGVNLVRSCGENNGSLIIDSKTGKLARNPSLLLASALLLLGQLVHLLLDPLLFVLLETTPLSPQVTSKPFHFAQRFENFHLNTNAHPFFPFLLQNR